MSGSFHVCLCSSRRCRAPDAEKRSDRTHRSSQGLLVLLPRLVSLVATCHDRHQNMSDTGQRLLRDIGRCRVLTLSRYGVIDRGGEMGGATIR